MSSVMATPARPNGPSMTFLCNLKKLLLILLQMSNCEFGRASIDRLSRSSCQAAGATTRCLENNLQRTTQVVRFGPLAESTRTENIGAIGQYRKEPLHLQDQPA